jgi:D-glycero-D-manno-heptose 1,7-bisphosphate phosphatase
MTAADYTPTGTPALFLDRDGVINRRRLDHVKTWAEFEFLPGALEALAQVRKQRIPVVVVTNQAVIGRGVLGYDQVADIHDRMLTAVEASGGYIDRIYVCPHKPEDQCSCRKPGTEMFARASRDLDISLAGSVMVGDSEGDVAAADAAGCDPVLVGEGRPNGLRPEVPVVPDLAGALPIIRRLTRRVATCC